MLSGMTVFKFAKESKEKRVGNEIAKDITTKKAGNGIAHSENCMYNGRY